MGIATFERQKSTRMSLAIDVLEPSALLIVCQVLDGALLTRLRGVKPGIGGAANVRFCLAEFRGCLGRKANIQVDVPTLFLGDIQPLFRNVRSDGVEPN